MFKHALATAAIVAGLAAGVDAAQIDYDEAISGDLSDDIYNPTVFTLDTAGVNTWVGTGATPSSLPGTRDLDRFEINLAPGLQIVDYVLSVSNIVHFPDSDHLSANGWIQITAQDLLQRYATHRDGDLGLRVTNPVALPWTDPLAVRVEYARGDATRYSWDWQVSLVAAPVDAVPVPAALPLLAAGLALLGGLGLRRRSRG